jgi:hypothetical protein
VRAIHAQLPFLTEFFPRALTALHSAEAPDPDNPEIRSAIAIINSQLKRTVLK